MIGPRHCPRGHVSHGPSSVDDSSNRRLGWNRRALPGAQPGVARRRVISDSQAGRWVAPANSSAACWTMFVIRSVGRARAAELAPDQGRPAASSPGIGTTQSGSAAALS